MIVQGTAEWHQARLGKVTASKVADVIAKTKSGPAATRANYAAQLVAERQTGKPTETFTNAAMAWGTEHEAEARAAYAFLHAPGPVTEVGFVDHPTIPMTGASPDGLVGDDGLLEIKCPQTATHIETLLAQTVPAKHKPQIQWQLACTGRRWLDFVSFDPRLSPAKQLFVARVERDEAYIAELEAEIVAFLAEVAETVARLDSAYPEAIAA